MSAISTVRTLAGELTDWALSVPTASLPDALMRAADERVIDTVGAALAGAASGLGTAATRVALSDPPGGGASVWAGGGAIRTAATAALGNGMLAHALDYDDTNTGATMHPGVAVVPAAVAVAEENGSSGRELLAAVAVGYEVAVRLGLAFPGDFQRGGFHATSVCGIFGATAAVSRLTGVDYATALNAMGLTGSFASGLMEYLADGSSAKQVHPGWAGQSAVRAVQLARAGATGPASVLEGKHGVFSSFIDRTPDPALVLEGLGSRWRGVEVATKPYPACHCNHAAVDSWFALRDAHGIADPENTIARLTARVPFWYLHLVGDPIEQKRRPRSVYEGRFSLPFSLGAAVVDGALGLDSYVQDRLTDPRILTIADRVDIEVVEFPTFPQAFPGGLRVELRDGSVFEHDIAHNAGSVGNPLSDAQFTRKFLDAASRAGNRYDADRLMHELRALVEPDSSMAGFTDAMGRFAI